MEFSSGVGGGGGDHHDGADSRRRKKRYHRHTPEQIQRLERMFRDCPHPDEKTRNLLSRELNLHPRQIKFWFQNRRTQMKAQHERADNCALRVENDKIRCENIAIREALKNVICPTCGGPPVNEDPFFNEQKLRIENAQLKQELDRVSSIAAKYMGRPLAQLPPMQPIHASSLDLSMSNFGSHGISGPSLDLDLLPGTSSSVITDIPFAPMSLSDMDKSAMADCAAGALNELIRLFQGSETLWMKPSSEGSEMLNVEAYDSMFPRSKNPNLRIEASRDASVVMMNSLALVDMFMDANKWIELFPTIVAKARIVEVISSGQNGTLVLMYEELQVLSSLVPTRQLYFLRFCQPIEPGSWAIVDVSYDITHQEGHFSSPCKALRLPSGCLIQDMPDGYSKVTWVEHWQVEDKAPIHQFYRELICSGFAFGAERWLSSLQRMCERIACSSMVTATQDLGGVIPSPEGKRSMMKLSQRMVNYFCSSINPSNGEQWNTLSANHDFEVRTTVHRSSDPGQPNGLVISASATIWLPILPLNVFNFLRDERCRPQWDVLNQNPVEEVAHIANGSHPGNCISVLRAYNTSQNNMLILQESCIDASGSLIVYCPVDLPAINIAMSGEDPSYIPLLPYGFTISSDGRSENSTSPSGSLITILFQILVSNLPSARMNHESVATVNSLISSTVNQIKGSLNIIST